MRSGALSAFLTLLIMVVVYFYWNDGPTYGYGNELIKWMSIAREFQTEHEAAEDVIAIDVAFDRTTVPYYTENDEYLGTVDITDRKKLTDFLKMLKERDAYRYIVCDVNFSDPQLKSEHDEELFNTIASMRDIVVASSDFDKDPELIRDKLALSKYKIHSVGDGFLKYDFMVEGKPSLALKMWQDIEGGTYEEFWWGAKMNGRPCMQTVIPSFRYAVYGDVYAEDCSISIQNMSNALRYYQMAPVYSRGYDDKIVLIGAWRNDDIHDTIIGQQPGVVIIYNAFLSLCNRDNQVSFWIYLIVFLTIWMEIMFIFRDSWTSVLRKRTRKNKWICRWKEGLEKFRRKHRVLWLVMDVISELINFATPLVLLMVIVYCTSGMFVNILVVGLFLGCISYLQKKFKFAL